MTTVSVSVTVPVAAAVETVFAAMVDLRSQDRWMLGTTLFAVDGDVAVPAVGSRIAALTGIGGVGVLDTMVVTVYDPPHRWETQHTGAFKGIGIFGVAPGTAGADVTWAEQIELPFGVVGRIGWRAVKPLVRWGLAVSLRALAKGVENGTLPVSGRPAPGAGSSSGSPES